ncbi:MAG: PD-(D/E)XK nuclease family protein, partial [bacterium]|nr:PD-(D/E)XK nuclease family protein [bacterium]
VDYKSTSKNAKIETLDEPWHEGYKRQMEIYQWLLRQRGFKVSDTGYFVYANASKEEEAFDGKLLFEVTLIPYKGSTAWVEKTLLELKQCLDGSALPAAGADCDYCQYREAVDKVTSKYIPTKALGKKKHDEKETSGLF